MDQRTRVVRIPVLKSNIKHLEERIEEIRDEIHRLGEGCDHTDGADKQLLEKPELAAMTGFGYCTLCGRGAQVRKG